MQIQIRTDNHIHVHEDRATELEDIVKHALRHCSSHITRVEMHLSDVNGSKPGPQDKCCVMEVRVEHHHPMAVTEHSETVGGSVTGASEKLARVVKSTLGRAVDKRPPAPEPPVADLDN